ncbi:MAG: polyprotein (domains: helicase, peptidase, RdRP) [Novo Mesto picornavirus 1]|nr:MAG: polyprotein (domains: helicase, peptidase, RdRP) [Novo Mesto picornavirus 1]
MVILSTLNNTAVDRYEPLFSAPSKVETLLLKYAREVSQSTGLPVSLPTAVGDHALTSDQPVLAGAQITDVINVVADKLLSLITSSLGATVDNLHLTCVASLGISIVSFVVQVINACKNPTTMSTKWVLPIMSLIQVATNIASVTIACGLQEFSAQKCTAALTDLINEYTNPIETLDNYVLNRVARQNAWDPNYILGICTNFITYTICMGATISGFDIRSINSLLTLREKSKTLSKDMRETAADILRDFFNYDVDVATSVTTVIQDLVRRTGELARTPEIEFLVNPPKADELSRLLKEIEDLQAARMSEAQQRAYSQARTLLNQQYQQLNKTHQSVMALGRTNRRPVTVGVVLNGAAGIGKSNVARHIMQEIAKDMGYSPSIYNLEMGPNGSYAEIYKREALGIYNEFAKTHDNTKAVYSINSIISDDPVNLEAAECAFKIQPCVLRLVFMTVNRNNLHFRQELNEAANVALITRMVEVDVEDAQYQGRGQPNLHRQPDYSHLTFVWKKLVKSVPTSLSDCDERERVSYSYSQFKELITNMLRQNEIQFLNRQVLNGDIDDPIRAAMAARVHQLNELLQASLAVRNANNTSFFVARWQGPRNYGKTTQCKNFLQVMRSAFHLEAYHITDPELVEMPKSTRAAVFVMDDIPVTKTNAVRYLAWINSIPKNSIVIIITNHVIPPEPITRLSQRHITESLGEPLSYAHTTVTDIVRALPRLVKQPRIRAFHLDNYETVAEPLSVAPGLSRRLGFCGLQMVGGEYIDPPPKSGICLTVGQQDFINLESSGPIDLALETGKAYVDYMRSSDEFLVLNQEAPNIRYDIWIEVRDFQKFKNNATTEYGYYQMFADQNNEGGVIHVDPSAVSGLLARTDPSAWIIPDLGTEDQISQVAQRYIYRLTNAFPGAVIKITHRNHQIFYANGIIYESTLPDMHEIVVVDGYVHFRGVPITPAIVAQLKVSGIHSGRPMNLPPFTPSQLVYVMRYVETHRQDEDMYLYREAMDQLEESMRRVAELKDSPWWRWLCTDSLLRNILLGSLAGVAAAASIYGAYKLFSGFKGDEDDDDDDGLPKPNASGDFSGKVDRTHSIAKDNREKMSKKTRGGGDIQYSWRSPNATAPVAPSRAIDVNKATKSELQEFVKGITEAKKNMVHNSLESSKNPRLDSIINKLRKNVCRVSTENGICHGLVICGRYILTVKHTVYNQDNITVIWSATARDVDRLYPAKIVAMDQSRDIAILLVDDLRFPEGNNIMSYLVNEDITDTWRADALYVRPLEVTEIVYGQAYHSDRYRTPLGTPSDPDWNPTMYYDFTPIHLGIGANQVRKGDCGLPLLRCVEGDYYIIGINCAISLIGEANFSMVSKEILSQMMKHETVKNMLEPEDLNVEDFVLIPRQVNIPDYNQFLSKIEDETKYDNHPEMTVLGYAKPFHLISNPKHSRVLVMPLDSPIKTDSAPSLLRNDQVGRLAWGAMQHDVTGSGNLHLTQAVKNYNRLPMLMSEHEFKENAWITSNYIAGHLGRNHKVLRTHQVINGILGEPLKNMPLATSAGPYMKMKYRIHDKKQLFTINSKPGAPVSYGFAETPAAKELAEQYYAGIHCIERGEAPLFVVKDNLKVEILPYEKIQSGESRLFCECDLVTNMWLRRYTGSVASALVEFHPFTGIATGMNPYLFATYTHKHTPSFYNVICSDLKRMDKTLHPWFTWFYVLCLKECSQQAGETGDQVWDALTTMLTDTVHFNNGILYAVSGGNPSGMFGTGPMNSLVIVFVIIKEYRRVQMSVGLICFSMPHFDSLVKKEILGDDMRLRTHPKLGITFESMQEAFKECGLVCVPSKTPGGELGDFCSRAYDWDEEEQIVYPRLRQSSIKDLVLWLRPEDKDLMVANFFAASFESSFWDEKFFDDINTTIKLQLESFRIKDFPFFSYKDHRRHFAKYVRGEERKPMLTDIGPNDVFDSLYEENAIIRQMSNVNALLEKYAQGHVPFDGIETATRDANTGQWKYTLTIRGADFVGLASKKSDAKNQAYGQALQSRNVFPAEQNAGRAGPWHKHSLRYRTEPASDGLHTVLAVYIDDKRVHELRRSPFDINHLTSEACISRMVHKHLDDVAESMRESFNYISGSPLTLRTQSTRTSDPSSPLPQVEADEEEELLLAPHPSYSQPQLPAAETVAEKYNRICEFAVADAMWGTIPSDED